MLSKNPVSAAILFCALATLPVWPDTAEEPGEMSEFITTPEKSGSDDTLPPSRNHRIGFAVGTIAAASSGSLPLSVEYEHLGAAPGTSLFINAFYALGGSDKELTRGVALGRRWYRGRNYQGPFLGISPTFMIGPEAGTPVLAALLGQGGFVWERAQWFLMGKAGLGPGVYWYPSPRYNAGSGDYETKTGTVAFSLDILVGMRF